MLDSRTSMMLAPLQGHGLGVILILGRFK